MSEKDDILNFCRLIEFISSKYYEQFNKECIELKNIRNEQNEKYKSDEHINKHLKIKKMYDEKFIKKWDEYQISETKNEIVEKIKELNLNDYFSEMGGRKILRLTSEEIKYPNFENRIIKHRFEFDNDEQCFIMQQLDNYFTFESNTQLFDFLYRTFKELNRSMKTLKEYSEKYW